ncbi:2-methylaconitate cis-trans isomerase PrpF family protein [Ancylobacter terrae]|uniref:2-methylaconitate cis-trans isomerase PrpF family protein n=1 Tax=Ancylobacter sp. sgz301288 TaxID=3342077 RepID=UPI0038585A3C
MAQVGVRAVFMRGGTSRALFFHRDDLPPATAPDYRPWEPALLAAMGSPDPNGRQLDGMGGGISSLSKVAIIARSARNDADVDYTFGQVAIDAPRIGWGGNCGNISAAVGPFALDEGLVAADGGEALVRIHNTNTGKLIHARFGVEDGKARVDGPFTLDGVAGTGAPIRLAFLEPGGATTGRLLPTGNARDVLALPGHGEVEVSLVDASNPLVFVAAAAIGLTGVELPADIDADPGQIARLEAIRVAAAVAMGLVPDAETARTKVTNLPFVAIVAAPRRAPLLSGATLEPDAIDVLARAISSGQPHRAFPATGAMCLAVAARIPGSVVAEAVRPDWDGGDLRLGHPSGILPVAASVSLREGRPHAEEAVVYRTARRLMEGTVLVPRRALQPA